jgi:hypothetical protein
MPDASNPNTDAPKLIVDTDWKAQAQAEKEKLAQKAAATKGAGPSLKVSGAGGGVAGAGVGVGSAAGVAGAGAEAGEELKPFEELLRMLAMQALSFLGEVPDPRTGQRMFAPEYARLYIDMMGSLEERTKGNLSKDEQEMLTGLLSDLRMTWVEMTKAVAKAVQEGKIKTVQPGQGGMGGAGGPGIVTPGGI